MAPTQRAPVRPNRCPDADLQACRSTRRAKGRGGGKGSDHACITPVETPLGRPSHLTAPQAVANLPHRPINSGEGCGSSPPEPQAQPGRITGLLPRPANNAEDAHDLRPFAQIDALW